MRVHFMRGQAAVVAIIAAGALLAACGDGDDQAAQSDLAAKTGADLVTAAEEEGKVVWYTSIPTETAEAVAAAFEKKYPKIDAEVVRAVTFDLYQRLLTENNAGQHLADVFNPSDFGVISDARDKGMLAKYVPESIKGAVDERFIDPDGYWWSARISTVGIVYNTEAVPPERAPSTWDDLTDPYWAGGKLGFTDPREVAIGYAAFWEMAQEPAIGEEFFAKLGQNAKPRQYSEAGQQLNALTTGELSCAVMVDYRGWELIGEGAPVKIVYPEEGVGYGTDFDAVLAEAPHPYAARLFDEFLGTEEGSNEIARYGGYMSRPEAELYPPGVPRPTLNELNLLTADFPQMAKESEDFGEKWAGWTE
ncbi:ABC transporter substrate-binding protein [Actinophytocola sp.]|uniref:ABC transporter substrate-binding protein n=1 Tax=Actinophytocola sp. TaxID=1872138 RepID=UPI003D6AB91A